jgi:septal ring factor EnvC (AmiA/AmiB activator)
MATTTQPETITNPVPAAPTTMERADARAIVEQWCREWMEQNPDADTLPDDLAELSQMADDDLRTKMARLGLAIRRRGQDTDAIRAEVKVLQARLAAREHEVERMKRYATLCLEIAGETKVETPLVTVALQQNPPSVRGELTQEVLDALWAHASPLVKFVPATYSLDKRAALDLFKQGGELPAGLTVERSTSLRIR